MPKVFPNQKPVTVETREDGTTTISGYAAVYHRSEDAGTQYQLMDSYYERIKPGAFDRALAEKQDVRALFNHDANHVLGRTTSGTCRLSCDSVGLRYEVDLPNTQVAGIWQNLSAVVMYPDHHLHSALIRKASRLNVLKMA